MATAVLKTTNTPRRENLARSVITIAIVAGLAVAALSYLASSLQIPAPAQRAETAELEARGAQVWVTFCSESAYEPHFWPECTEAVPEWRERGAERLIRFCTEGVPSRLFTADDCLAADRPMLALAGGPRPQDAVAGVIGAVVVAAVVGGLAWYRSRREA